MGEWTSVKDSLPKEAGRYLVVTGRRPDYAFIAHFAPSLSEVDHRAFTTSRPGFWGTDDAAIFAYPSVICWMPLPKTPAEMELTTKKE